MDGRAWLARAHSRRVEFHGGHPLAAEPDILANIGVRPAVVIYKSGKLHTESDNTSRIGLGPVADLERTIRAA